MRSRGELLPIGITISFLGLGIFPQPFADLMLRATPSLLTPVILGTTLVGSAFAQPTVLVPENPPNSGGFGFAVAVSRDLAVSGAPGIQGGTDHGVFLFTRGPEGWVEDGELVPEGDEGDSKYGAAVDTDGERIVVGAEYSAGGGAAYIFARSGSHWVQEAKVTSEGGAAPDFGYDVTVLGDLAVVGAPAWNRSLRGEAFVFRYTDGVWEPEALLQGNDTGPDDHFGQAVRIAGPDEVWVSAPQHVGEFAYGAVYRFVHDDGEWTQVGRFTNPYVPNAPVSYPTGGQFGYSFDVDGDLAAFGSPAFFPAFTPESVFIYRRQGSDWILEEYIVNPAGNEASMFGISVDLNGNELLIGSPYGISEERANRFSDGARGSSRSNGHWYSRSSGQWRERARISNPEDDGDLGFSVALGDDDLLVGVPRSHQYGTYTGLVYAYPRDAFPTPTEATAPAGDAHLSAAYPNPFTNRAQLVLTLERPEQVRAALYDVLGRRAAVLHDGTLQAGDSPLYVEASGLPAGVYFVRVQGETFEESRRVTVTR